MSLSSCSTGEIFETMDKQLIELAKEGDLDAQRAVGGILKEQSDQRKLGMKNTRRSLKRNRYINNESKCLVCEIDNNFLLCVHHIVAVADGGTNSPKNLMVLCHNCHRLIHTIIGKNDKERVFALNYFFENHSKDKFNLILNKYKCRTN